MHLVAEIRPWHNPCTHAKATNVQALQGQFLAQIETSMRWVTSYSTDITCLPYSSPEALSTLPPSIWARSTIVSCSWFHDKTRWVCYQILVPALDMLEAQAAIWLLDVHQGLLQQVRQAPQPITRHATSWDATTAYSSSTGWSAQPTAIQMAPLLPSHHAMLQCKSQTPIPFSQLQPYPLGSSPQWWQSTNGPCQKPQLTSSPLATTSHHCPKHSQDDRPNLQPQLSPNLGGYVQTA